MLFANCKCVFTEERIETGHAAIKPRLVEYFDDVCSSVDFCIYDHGDQVLGHHTNQSPSPSFAQFGQEGSSRKSPGSFKLITIL